MFDAPDVFTHFSARRWLDRLHDELGAAGLTAAAALPGLSALLDQHAAAVRDATTLGLEGSAAVAGLAMLASYGHGVRGYAREHGWQPPADPAAWCAADWISLRLAAVCSLAQTRRMAPVSDRTSPKPPQDRLPPRPPGSTM